MPGTEQHSRTKGPLSHTDALFPALHHPARDRAGIKVLGILVACMSLCGISQAQTSWSTLSSAVTATPAGGTVTLANDIPYDSGTTITLNKTLGLQSSVPSTLRTISGRSPSPFRLFNITGASNRITLGDLLLTNGGGATGGGIYVTNGIVEALPGSTLAFCNNAGGAGGAFYIANGTVTLQKLEVSDNTATGDGGGLYIAGSRLLTVLGDASFVNNESSANGGAIMNVGSVVFGAPDAPVNVTFQNNRARYSTAFYNYTASSSATFYGDVSFINNTTTLSSYGYYGGALDTDGTVLITGNAYFDGNRAPNYGGGSYNYSHSNTAITINGNATYLNNSSLRDGGGHYSSNNSAYTVNGDASFQNNLAARYGGALYTDSSKAITLNAINSDQVYSGNVARNSGSAPATAAGGFLYLDGSDTSLIFNVADSRQLTIGTCLMDGTDSIANNGTGATVAKAGAGTLTLSADNSAFNGVWNVNGGLMRGGCPNTFAPTGHTVAAGAELSANGFSQTVRDITNNGIVSTGSANSAPGATLTVTRNYTGAAGSELHLNTALGDSGSPTDVMIIQTNPAATSTAVFINNIGGAGAQTTGNGILIIQVNGTSSGTFTMTPVVAGDYIYRLVKVDSNWYLQSTLLPEITVTKQVTGAMFGYDGRQFAITVDCGSAGSTVMHLANGDSGSLRMPDDASCAVSEAPTTNPIGYTYTSSIDTPAFTMPISGQAVVVTNTLTAQLQPIAITATVAGATAGYPAGSPFAISIDCGAGGSNTYSLADGQSATFNAPVGVACTVTETAPADPSGYAYTTDITPDSFTVGIGGEAVTVTNTLRALPQTITVTKNLTGDMDGYDGTRFRIQIDCGTAGSSILRLTSGESGTYQAPTGSICSISETLQTAPAGYRYNLSGITPASPFTVPPAGGVAVAVNNTITALDQPITLQKTISGDDHGYTAGGTFSITLDCAIAGSRTVSLARNGTATLNATTGDTCTVTEQTPANPPGFAYEPATITPTSFTVAAGGQIVNIDNSLTAQNQTLIVKKDVTATGGGYPAGSTFTIIVDCGTNGSKTLTLANGASGTFDPPTGATCTITEATPANPSGYAYSAPSYTPAQTVPIPAGTTMVTVGNTLTPLLQTITVNKYLSGDVRGYPPSDEFTVTVACDGQPPEVRNVPASGTFNFQAPTGVACTVSETLPANPGGYTYETVSIEPASFTVPAGGQTVSVTNSLTAQGQPITVTKMVTGDTHGYPAGEEFQIAVRCTNTGTVRLNLANGTSGTFNAPTDDTCTVTETAPTAPDGFAYGAPVISPASFTVAPGGNDILVSNPITAQHQPITINKTVSGNTEGAAPGATFPVTVTCTPPIGAITTNVLNLADGASDNTLSAPTGAICVVTEGAPASGSASPGYEWDTPLITPARFTMPAGGQTVQITNGLTATSQNLSVTKALGGDIAGEVPGTQFAILVDCDDGKPQRSLSLAGGVTGTLQVAAGRTCTVTEPSLPVPVPGYVYMQEEINPPLSFMMTAGGNSVIVSNRLQAQPQTITVQKNVTGDTAGYVSAATFPVTVTCTPSSGLTESTVVNLANSGTATVNAVTGSVCTVSETIPAGAALPGYAWNTPVYSPRSFTVAEGGRTVTVTNELAAQNQTITVTKTLADATGVYDNAVFTIQAVCGSGIGTVTLPLTAGGSATFDAPTDTSCTLSETLPAAPAGYHYDTPLFAPNNTLTVPAGGATLAVSNTLIADPQPIVIDKTVSGTVRGYQGSSFDLTLACDNGSSTPFQLVGGGSQTIQIPTGVSCQVTEAQPLDPAGYRYTSPSIQPSAAFTVPPAGRNVAVTNTLSALGQTMTIRNNVFGPSAGYVPGSTFGISVDCDEMAPFTIQIGRNTSRTFTAPTGVECRIGQTATPGATPGYAYGAPTIKPARITVPAGGATIAVTNTLSALPQQLEVTKRVTGDTSGYVPGTPFSVNVSCGGINHTLSLVDGGSNTSISAPTGTTCSVSEGTPTNPPGYRYDTPQISPASFQMPSGGQSVTIINNLVIDPAITITKNVTGDTAGYVPGTPFTINVDCDGTIRTVQVAGGSSNASIRAPIGALCTVTEDTPVNPGGYSYETPQITPASFTMGAGGQVVTVTNNIIRHPLLTVNKSVTGLLSAYSNEQFCIRILCDDTNFERVIHLRHGDIDSSIRLPVGTMCTISKDTPANPPGCRYDPPQITPASFIMTASGQTVNIISHLRALARSGTLDIPATPAWLLLLLATAIAGMVYRRQRRR